MKIFDEAMTREALPFGRLIQRLQDMFRAGCVVPPRHVHVIKTDTVQGTVLIMPAWTGRYLGVKTVNVYPDNFRRGLPCVSSAYILFDATTGGVLAQMDGNVITSRRTAAASALAASYLATQKRSRLLVVGAGQVGRLLPLAYREVVQLDAVEIWNRSYATADQLATEVRALGIPCNATRDLPAAVGRADIVSCATSAKEPILRGGWLSTGVHVDLIGSFTPEMREADDNVFADASIFVDTEEALQTSGDLIWPLARGVIPHSAVRGSLSQLCCGTVQGRARKDDRTVFKSVGTALLDLASAISVYEYATDVSQVPTST